MTNKPHAQIEECDLDFCADLAQCLQAISDDGHIYWDRPSMFQLIADFRAERERLARRDEARKWRCMADELPAALLDADLGKLAELPGLADKWERKSASVRSYIESLDETNRAVEAATVSDNIEQCAAELRALLAPAAPTGSNES